LLHQQSLPRQRAAESLRARAALSSLVLSISFAVAPVPTSAQTIPSGCTSSVGGTALNCSGDRSGGVILNTIGSSETYTTLEVDNLTSNITPSVGPGVSFDGNGEVNLFIDLGPWKIVTASNSEAAVTAGNLTTDPVNVAIIGAIETSGPSSPGIVVSTDDGSVAIDSQARITTLGDGSHGISTATVTSNIAISSFGAISTSGHAANGIHASSQSGNIAIASFGRIDTQAEFAVGIFADSVTGNIGVESSGSISTHSDDATGIFVQTGGTAIIANYGNITTSGDGASGIAISAVGGAVVSSIGNITTAGDNAVGISVMANGDAGIVSNGNITTTGTASDGISVRSLAGTAVVLSSGRISATGTGSAGIYVDGETAAILMNYGSVVGGPCCAGVMMDSAHYNMLLNHGTITADLSDFAIDLKAPTNSVDNFGAITGNIRLFDGFDPTGSFTNHASGLVNSGESITAAFVTNDGTLSPGGRARIQDTLIGEPSSSVPTQFIQGSSGILAIDVDAAHATSDRVGVVGSADLAGTVDVKITSLPASATQSFLIVATNDGVTNNGLSVTASPVLHASLSFASPNDVVLGIAVDFGVDGLNRNQRALAGHLNGVLGAGGGGVTPVLLGLLNTDDLGSYRNALDQLTPEVYSDTQIAALYSNLAFTGSLMSCKINGTDTASIIREGQCLWAGASARFLDSGTTSQQIGFKDTAGLFTAGAQVALDDVWRLGIAGGYQSSDITTPTGASSQGALGQAGIALKYNPGQLLLAGAITGGGGQYDTHRVMSFGGFSGSADSTQNLGVLSGTLRAAYVFGDPGLYIKPSLDATLTYLSLGSFTESSATGLGLAVDGQDQTVFQLAPTLEAGTEFWLGNGTLVRPLIRGGAIWYANPDMTLTAAFADAPLLSDGSSVGGFTILTKMDEVMGIVGAGLDVISGTDAVMRFSYDAQLGSTTQIHSVGIKGSAKF